MVVARQSQESLCRTRRKSNAKGSKLPATNYSDDVKDNCLEAFANY